MRYFIGLGSNLEPHRHLPLMLHALSELAPVLHVGRVVATAPVAVSGGTFLNVPVCFDSALEPAALKAIFNRIEADLGRDRSNPASKRLSRTADLDLLFGLPEAATDVPDALLPAEAYMRPMLLELLAYLQLRSPADVPDLAPGLALELEGLSFGTAPVSLRRSAMTITPLRPAALVTGGAVRLGRAIALALATAGYDIALHYGHSRGPAEETATAIRALGATCELFQHDLAEAEGLPALVEQARSALPNLRVLLNSASAYGQATIATTTPATFDQQFAVNLRAPFFLTQAFAAQVGQGHVINIIDNKVAFNQYQYAAYLLAKQALAAFTRMAALEFAPALQVNGVAPGVVLPATTRSEEYIAWRVSGIPLRRQGRTADITGALLYLLASPFITGQVLTVDGGEGLTGVGQNAAQFDPEKV